MKFFARIGLGRYNFKSEEGEIDNAGPQCIGHQYAMP